MLRSLLFAVALVLPLNMAVAADKRPNLLVIVADDLGFSDIGAFGGEIDTPNLDKLALGGVRLTGFHTAPTCSPTRAMLLSGTDNQSAGLGAMGESVSPNQRGKPGYEGYLRADVATLAERLSAGGYRTLFSGKWHLGVAPDQDPHARGFQHAFALLQGTHNHFGVGIAQDPKRGTVYREDGRTLSALPQDFYSSDTFAAKLIAQLKDSRQGEGADKPFFAYLAFTAPHFPLQAPPELIAKYKGRYDAGYDELRRARLKRQAELGLVDPAKPAHPMELAPRWDDLSPEQKAVAARQMEVYAAMVDSLDQNVGRVIEALRRTGELDDTVILFMSDNGAEGVDLANNVHTRGQGGNSDDRLDNIGAANSYVGYGPGWAQAATAPSRLYKGVITEGGTRAVAFLAGKPVGEPGVVRPAFTSVMDVAPTLLELAGVDAAATEIEGRRVRPVTGRSWTAMLSGKADQVYPPQVGVGMQFISGRAYWQGDWKVTDIGDGWRLFNIAADPGETQDLSAKQPKRKAALIKAYERYAEEVGVVMPDPPIVYP